MCGTRMCVRACSHVWLHACAREVCLSSFASPPLLLSFILHSPFLSSVCLTLTFSALPNTLSPFHHTDTQRIKICFSSSLVLLFLCGGLFFPRDQKMKVTQPMQEAERREVSHWDCWCSSAPGHGGDSCEGGGGRAREEGVSCCGTDSADCRKLYPLISPATPGDKGLRERIG